MAATDDQDTVEAVFAQGAHPPFRVGVRVRRPNRVGFVFDEFAADRLRRPPPRPRRSDAPRLGGTAS
jgi:hypothetical protein